MQKKQRNFSACAVPEIRSAASTASRPFECAEASHRADAQGLDSVTSRRNRKSGLCPSTIQDCMLTAITREKTMKKWPRKWKLNLIEAMNPNWEDIAQCDRLLVEAGVGVSLQAQTKAARLPGPLHTVKCAETQMVLAKATAVSDMRLEKPHSLSYQDSTRTKLPSRTLVWSKAKIDEWLSWLKSRETKGSSV
jgi:predicted GIY-YIG superfamily endonuclease